jgi:hypothetical protein
MSDPDKTEVTEERADFDLQFAIVRFRKVQILRLAWQAGRVLVCSKDAPDISPGSCISSSDSKVG